MLENLLFLALFIALTIGAFWLVLRMRRAQSRAVKWVGLTAGSLVALILLVVTGLGIRGLVYLYLPADRVAPDLKVEMTPARIARGAEIANLCASCHSPDGKVPLAGGHNLSDEVKMPFGDLYPINLTPAGPLKTWTDGQIFRAIRHGRDEKGNRLPVMSAQRVRNLSDDDIQSVIAYIRSQPPVQRETPPPRPSFLAAMMSGAGMLPSLPEPAPDYVVGPPRGPTRQYGEYTVGWMGCDECHGPNLEGGKPGFLPVGPNLRSVKNWTREGFITAMRTGKTPHGKQLDSLQMPWKAIGRFSDDDLTAIHAYLAELR